jgi:hypothetical protein
VDGNEGVAGAGREGKHLFAFESEGLVGRLGIELGGYGLDLDGLGDLAEDEAGVDLGRLAAAQREDAAGELLEALGFDLEGVIAGRDLRKDVASVGGPGTTAALGSVMRPLMVPVKAWGKALATRRKKVVER